MNAASRSVVVCGFALGWVAPGGAVHAQQGAPRVIETRAVAAGVVALPMHPDGTVLVVNAAGGTLIVDAGAAAMAERVDSAVAAAATGPVRWVVSTHYHADHIGGNGRFRAAGAELIGHENLALEAARDTTIAELEWRREAAPGDALPTRTFRDSLVIDMNGETAVAVHAPQAHTSGDALVFLRRANVVHTGDIVEFGAYPFIDRWAGGSIDGLIDAVDLILSRSNDGTRIVPGHGGVFGRADVGAYRTMLVDLRARVQAAVRDGRSADDLVASGITAAYDARHGGARRGERFTRLLYSEIVAAASSEVRTYEVPAHPTMAATSGPIPYELRVAPDGAVWMSELAGNRVVRFDPDGGTFAVHTMPSAHFGTGSADAIVAFDPATERFNVYRLPTRGAMIRHITSDPRNGDVWAAYGASPGIPAKVARLRPDVP